MTEPLAHDREQGIRLQQQINFDPAVDALLTEVGRLRDLVHAMETQLSVYERRDRVSRPSTLTTSEETMLKFALDCTQEVVLSANTFEFTPADMEALKSLREWLGMP